VQMLLITKACRGAHNHVMGILASTLSSKLTCANYHRLGVIARAGERGSRASNANHVMLDIWGAVICDRVPPRFSSSSQRSGQRYGEQQQ
jgi:hypothetical protein